MKRKQFLILIILLVIGFASVSTTLILKGNIGVGVELDDFDVIFTEALLDGKEDTKATISEDKKTITFTTDRLRELNDSARLDYKVKNTSTQYDADVTINCTNEANEYVTVTSSFDGNAIPLVNPVNIKAQEVKNGYINAELTKVYAGEDTSIEISCKIIFTATSREDYAYSLNFDSNGGSKIDDKSITLNDSYGELQVPTRIGYNFLGWYDANNNQVDEDTILDSKENKTLYAKWEEKVYSVNIVAKDNGSSENNTLNITYGKDSNIKITPSNNYYISSIECSDGYLVEEYNPKEPKYGEQTIKIKNNKVDKSGTCTFTFAQGIFEFDYTGKEQELIVPCDGTYQLETWGAQGGNDGPGNGVLQMGGYGAFSTGQVLLYKGDLLYFNVGSRGNLRFNAIDSYNGGGLAVSSGAGGGGATHIATSSKGTLMNYKNAIDDLLIVAGGGGGAGDNASGGHAGGIKGVNGAGTSPGSGATQNSGYAFGLGADVSGQNPAGGGGYYGGNRSNGGTYGGGGGGSSYIGNPLLSNKVMYCYKCTQSNEVSTKTISTTCTSSTPTANCAKQGNGYAKITYLGE